MKKKCIKVDKIIKFKYFIFNPHFDQGRHSGIFELYGIVKGTSARMSTGKIEDIFEDNGKIYVKNKNNIYLLEGAENVKVIKPIKRYLHSRDSSSETFFKKYVTNMVPSYRGWRVY